jgi:hypothetical protein
MSSFFIIVGDQGYPFAGCHFIDTHAEGFNHNLSLNDKRSDPSIPGGVGPSDGGLILSNDRTGRPKREIMKNEICIFVYKFLNLPILERHTETLYSTAFRKMSGCHKNIAVVGEMTWFIPNLGNGTDFVHSLSTFTIP